MNKTLFNHHSRAIILFSVIVPNPKRMNTKCQLAGKGQILPRFEVLQQVSGFLISSKWQEL